MKRQRDALLVAIGLLACVMLFWSLPERVGDDANIDLFPGSGEVPVPTYTTEDVNTGLGLSDERMMVIIVDGVERPGLLELVLSTACEVSKK